MLTVELHFTKHRHVGLTRRGRTQEKKKARARCQIGSPKDMGGGLVRKIWDDDLCVFSFYSILKED